MIWKKIMLIFFLILSVIGCSKKIETQFNNKSLQDILLTKQGDSIRVADIFKPKSNKKRVINIWASWCKDCLNSIPENNILKKQYSQFEYINISIDKSYNDWSNALKKYEVLGTHYYLPSGWDGSFGKFLQLDWIPRYLIVNEDETIEVFDCTRLKENVLDDTLKK